MAKKTPEIRFEGFDDDWEQRKVRDYAQETYGGGTPKTTIEEYWTGDIDWIQSSDLTEHQIFDVVAKKHISKVGVNNSATKLVPANSIAIVTRVGVGKLAFMPNEYATSQDFLSLSKLNIDGKFSVYSLYIKLQSELHAVQGTSIKGITKEELLSKRIMIPIDKDEQVKIGLFFKQLDDIITLQQRKLELLKEQKKSFLQKMFPKNGSDKPEIRFAGFTDAWEQRKLKDESKISAGGDIDKSKVKQNGKYPVIANALTDEGIVGYYDEDYRIKAPAVTVTGRGDVGHARARKVNFTPVVRLLSVKSIHDVDFLENAINNVNFFIESTGVPQLTAPQLENLKIYFPCLEEQKKIGLFFKQLDDIITLQQQQLETLQKMKKAFLQKMFV